MIATKDSMNPTPKTPDSSRPKKGKKLRVPHAASASKYDLYQRSVQEPEADVEFMNETFEAEFGVRPHTLREDFCGTGWVCCTWAADHPENQAYGYDIDPEPMQWGLENNASKLTDEQRTRVSLTEGNCLDVCGPKVDIIAGTNFSYFLFKKREELREYFKAALANLKDKGMFALDIMGGPDAIIEGPEEREVDDFLYVWDQVRHDPISNGIESTISFRFKDGSALNKCFEYSWRLWSIPEVREILEEAGFTETAVYWEGTDEDTDEGDGNFEREENAETCDCFIAYVVGFKK